MQLLLISSGWWFKKEHGNIILTINDSINECHWDWLLNSRFLYRNIFFNREKIPLCKITQWIEDADVNQAVLLARNNLIEYNQIPENKRTIWCKNADKMQASLLVRTGIILREQIPSAKRKSWAKSNSLKNTKINAGMGIIGRDDIPNAILHRYAETADFKSLKTLIRLGILRFDDIQEPRRTHLENRMGIKNRSLITHEAIEHEIKPGAVQNPPLKQDRYYYTKEEIQDNGRRKVVERKLEGAIWEMIVVHINPDGMSGFAAHPSFNWNLYFQKQRLALAQDAPLKKGDILEAEVVIIFNTKRKEWNFAIKRGTRTVCASYDIPDWWQAWQFFAPRWEMAAEGQYFLQPELFNKLQSEGFDTERLRSWNPTDKDGRRVKLANRLVQIAMNEPADSLPQRKTHIAQQLAGDGVWFDLRRLAEAYLDGKLMFSQLSRVPIDKQNTSNNSASVSINSVSTRTKKLSVARDSALSNTSQKTALPSHDKSFSQFINGSTNFTVYIDETWTGEDTAIEDNEGVIAGVLCIGEPEQVFNELPKIETHSFKDASISRSAITKLLACSKCRPFIFPIRMMHKDQCAQQHYDLMLQHAIRLLCGWLVKPQKRTRISIFFERIAEHHEGKDGTAFIQGGWLITPERFQNWKLATVRWEVKDFGYLPYADLLAYMARGSSKANRLGALANYKQLPGYVPFSLELVPRLERLEHLETSANLDDVIDFALETGDSPFGRVVMQDIAKRLANRVDLQQRLLETLEARYRDKVRDLKQLRRAFQAVHGLLPSLPENASPRMRLLWYLLALQDANHDGDPQRIRDTAGTYLQEREQLKKSDRDLCADADLNLAVHYSDHFAFSHAEVTVGDWIYDPLFAALSDRQQGRFYSALGQYRAMQGDAEGADGFFAKALKLFGDAPMTEDERQQECDQTNIYRAINAIDGSLRVAPQALEAVFGAAITPALAEQFAADQETRIVMVPPNGHITPALAEQFAADGSVENQYRHHLLLRALALRAEYAEARDAYLAVREHWQPGHAQHPWPSIHGHRGFLLWDYGDPEDEQTDESACAAFDQAILLAVQDHHGPTVKLIGALWATVAACCYADCDYENTGREFLEQVRVLPDAEAAITALENVLAAPDPERIGEAFAAVPFNYR